MVVHLGNLTKLEHREHKEGWVKVRLEVLPHILPVFSFPEFFNHSCTFPFAYGDVIYYSCISVRSHYAWCSIDEVFQGRWRYCTAEDPPKCTFPFLYRNQLFDSCTKEGYVLNRSWCSLTKDYNQDGKWKQCSPYK
uniref:Fibronectin type-II domain-containing protein n=1 Tax=Balaenoptera musculus TaxID=9771 RepID=A0A8C0DYC1_BALMU